MHKRDLVWQDISVLWNMGRFLEDSCRWAVTIVKAWLWTSESWWAGNVHGRGQRWMTADSTARLLFAQVTRPVVTERSLLAHEFRNCCWCCCNTQLMGARQDVPEWRETDRRAMSAIRRRDSSLYSSATLVIEVSHRMCVCSRDIILMPY